MKHYLKLPATAKWLLFAMASWAVLHAYPSAREKRILIVGRRLGDNMINIQSLAVAPSTNLTETAGNENQ